MIETDVPLMPRGVRLHFCSIRQQWFLLAPERALAIDDVAHAVLSSVDGQSSVAEIAGTLAKTYDAAESRIQSDCLTLLTDLEKQRIIDITSAPHAEGCADG